MSIHKSIWLVPLLGLLAMPVFAGHGANHADRLEQRIDRQHDRIRHGIRSGELTRWEARKLRKQHRRIVRLEDRYLRDGRLDRQERRKLRHKLDKASERIYEFKHNEHRKIAAVRHHRGWSWPRDEDARYGYHTRGGRSFEQWQADNG